MLNLRSTVLYGSHFMNHQPKQHHFVPQIYLKQFADEGQVFVLDIHKVKKGWKEMPHKKYPAAICYEEAYYTIEKNDSTKSLQLDGLDALHIETNVLHQLENVYPELLEAVTNQPEIDMPTAINLADFILQIKLRNPFHFREVIEKKQGENVKQILSEILDRDERFKVLAEVTREQLREHLRSMATSVEYAKALQLFSLWSRTLPQNNERIRRAMLNSRWYVFDIPETGPRFITTDNPGVSLGKNNQYYSTRFTNGYIFYFPLSYRYCLAITDEQPDNAYDLQLPLKSIQHQQADSQLILHINDSLIQRINKLIIGSDGWYLTQIAALNKPKRSTSNNQQ